MAFISTNLVYGNGPSAASTSKITPLTIIKARSTSPPKSACPGVSKILILIGFSFPQTTEQFLADIVIPLSFSKS